MSLVALIALAVTAPGLAPGAVTPASADPFLLPFFPTPMVPSRPPLAFGMTASDVAFALDARLVYISGSHGNEVLAASLPGNNTLFARGDRIYLQFRHGQLTGWKGDWNIAWVGP